MISSINIIDLNEDLNYKIEQNITLTTGIDAPSNKIKILFDVCDRNQTIIINDKIHTGRIYLLQCETSNNSNPILIQNKKCMNIKIVSSHMYDTIMLQFQ